MALIPAGTVLTVETKYFPPFVVDLGEPSTGPGLAGFVTKLLRPRVTLTLKGQVITQVEPAGSPDPSRWPTTKLVLIAVTALAVFTVLRIIK